MTKTTIRTDRVTISRLSPVGWFSLRLLVTIGIKALVNSLIGAQTGRRELLAALDTSSPTAMPTPIMGQAGAKGPIWIDYIADLGDGFDATHSVAWLSARDYLFVNEPGEQVAQPNPKLPNEEPKSYAAPDAEHALPRADLVIFGGDQVYPYATQEEYEHRTYEPYFAARPWGSPDPEANGTAGSRPLFVIPGNHDWYDGLVSFVRLFCQTQPPRWIGALFASQPRSYFSIKLPHGWWIWGVDVASEDDIDPPQLAYFQNQAANMKPGDKLLLCTAKPAWVECIEQPGTTGTPVEPSPDAWNKLVKISKIAEGGGAEVPVFLSGDLHHYARHQGGDGKQFITCGGGGAFTLGTTIQPAALVFGPGKTAERKAAFPSIDDSKAKRIGALMIVSRHKLFCATLALIMLSMVWLLHSDSQMLRAAIPDALYLGLPFLTAVRESPAGLLQIWTILINGPGTALILLLIGLTFWGFASSGEKKHSWPGTSPLLGALHFAAQLCLAIYVAVFMDFILEALAGSSARDGFAMVLAFVILCLGAGTLACGVLFGAYLYLSNRGFGWHEQEVYSSQAIQEWKCFLRIKVTAEALTIYPIGLREVGSNWQPTLTATPDEPVGRMSKLRRNVSSLFATDSFEVPKGTTHLYYPETPLKPELIEAPVVLAKAEAVEKVSADAPIPAPKQASTATRKPRARKS